MSYRTDNTQGNSALITTTFAEDPGLVPNTYIRSSQLPVAVVYLHCMHMKYINSQMYTCMYAHTQLLKTKLE